MSPGTRIRLVMPTKDRPGSVGAALTCVALALEAGDELVLYDDGHRPATADYLARFALDLALQKGVAVAVKRGKPQGVHKVRANMLEDANLAGTAYLVMVDDDTMVTRSLLRRLVGMLEEDRSLQYAVPLIGLANNEAGLERFGDDSSVSATHAQQYEADGVGTKQIDGGAWTCAIALAMDRLDSGLLASQLRSGPSVVEDYVLTSKLHGAVDRGLIAWHAMTPAQGPRDWNGKALAYLRDSLR